MSALENPPSEPVPAATPASCTHCHEAFREPFFQANGAPFCGTCIEALRTSLQGRGSSVSRFLRATLLGCGAAAASAISYGLFMGLTGIEFALVTIAIGWFIGKAVRNGSGNRGGWRYGLLAVVLTYCAIAFSYFGVAVATELKGEGVSSASAPAAGSAQEEDSAGAVETKPIENAASTAPAESASPKAASVNPLVALGVLVVTAFAMPILVATQSILSAVITGFGLWESWKINRGTPAPEITGPHPVAL